jgi:hypothetical protein
LQKCQAQELLDNYGCLHILQTVQARFPEKKRSWYQRISALQPITGNKWVTICCVSKVCPAKSESSLYSTEVYKGCPLSTIYRIYVQCMWWRYFLPAREMSKGPLSKKDIWRKKIILRKCHSNGNNQINEECMKPIFVSYLMSDVQAKNTHFNKAKQKGESQWKIQKTITKR